MKLAGTLLGSLLGDNVRGTADRVNCVYTGGEIGELTCRASE